MATTIAYSYRQFLFNALDTYNYTIQNAGTHAISVKLTDVTSLSGLTVTIKNNSTTLATLTGVTGNPGGAEINLRALCNCAVNDVVGIIVTSSAAGDSAPDRIKGKIIITLSPS